MKLIRECKQSCTEKQLLFSPESIKKPRVARAIARVITATNHSILPASSGNVTPTPRAPSSDASLVKNLVLYCSTLINVRNSGLRPLPPHSRAPQLYASLLPRAVTYPIFVNKKWSLTMEGVRWMGSFVLRTPVHTFRRMNTSMTRRMATPSAKRL